jgi:predicted peptidase
MKKKVFALLLSMSLVIAAVFNGNTLVKADAASQGQAGEFNLKSAHYVTVTEGFDWGPAITKVILYMKTAVDSSTLTTESFSVTVERKYSGFDYATGAIAERDEMKERKVTEAYVSDKNGNKSTKGRYITLEMQVGPTLSEGSPFATVASSMNDYVDTTYIIKLNENAALKTADGKVITMNPTDKSGYKRNISLVADDFDSTGIYNKGDITLRYASYTPENASADKGSNPLIIWLHGAGEGGKDPTIALLGNKVVSLATEKIQSCFGETGAYVLVPQCETMWMDYDGKGTYNNSVPGSQQKSYYTVALKGLIDQFLRNHPEIDKNRIYIGGCSNGGFMTMKMIISYPDFFAAAFPICEAFDNSNITDADIDSIKDMPVWFVHSKDDPVVSIYEGSLDYATFSYTLKLDENGKPIPLNNFSNAAYNRLVAAGAQNVHYSLFDKVVDTTGLYFIPGTTKPYGYIGHFAWIYALNNECTDSIDGSTVTLFDWMAKQSKSD